MNFGQRMMLLCSLFFFFGMGLMAIADWGGKRPGAFFASTLPRSVMTYPEDLPRETTIAANSVPCHAGAGYDQFIAQKRADGYILAVTGDVSDGDKMEIHAAPNGDFIVIVKGPDASGIMEGCQVSEGTALMDGPSAQSAAATAPLPIPAAD